MLQEPPKAPNRLTTDAVTGVADWKNGIMGFWRNTESFGILEGCLGCVVFHVRISHFAMGF